MANEVVAPVPRLDNRLQDCQRDEQVKGSGPNVDPCGGYLMAGDD